MALDDLYELVGELERRISNEGVALRQSEALTRYALVDPLLRALGWDTADAKSVVPEYRSAAGVADYALFSSGNQSGNRPPSVIIQAKKLDEPLGDITALQSLCNKVGTPYFALTDGRTWKLYATLEPAPLENRLIAEFIIGRMDAVVVCRKALALWRRSVDTGNVRISPPILPARQEDKEDIPPIDPDPDPDPAPQSEWIPISEYEPQPYERLSEIKFPDDTSVEIKYQKEIITEATRWLVSRGLLQPHNPAHCPITNNTRHLISTGNIHPNGISFESPRCVDGVFVETKAGNKQNIRYTRKIITRVGQDPSEFKVKRAG